MFWVKVFKTRQDLVIAICDEDILDKELSHNNIKVKIDKKFYGGKLVSEFVAVKLLEKATIANIFGNEIVQVAEKNGFIIRENAILIDGISHAQFVKIKY
jgi:hypothetical protein